MNTNGVGSNGGVWESIFSKSQNYQYHQTATSATLTATTVATTAFRVQSQTQSPNAKSAPELKRKMREEELRNKPVAKSPSAQSHATAATGTASFTPTDYTDMPSLETIPKEASAKPVSNTAASSSSTTAAAAPFDWTTIMLRFPSSGIAFDPDEKEEDEKVHSSKKQKEERPTRRERSRSPARTQGSRERSRERDYNAQKIEVWNQQYNKYMNEASSHMYLCTLLWDAVTLELPRKYDDKVQKVAQKIYEKIEGLTQTELRHYLLNCLRLGIAISGFSKRVMELEKGPAIILNFLNELREEEVENASKLWMNFGDVYGDCFNSCHKLGPTALRTAVCIYDKLEPAQRRQFRTDNRETFKKIVTGIHVNVKMNIHYIEDIVYNLAYIGVDDKRLLAKSPKSKQIALNVIFQSFEKFVKNSFCKLQAFLEICDRYCEEFDPITMEKTAALLRQRLITLNGQDVPDIKVFARPIIAKMQKIVLERSGFDKEARERLSKHFAAFNVD